MAQPDDAYDRGHIAGEIAARLAGHDQHFATINGSLADIAQELHKQTLAVQRLSDQAEANAKTVITTAAALKDAEDARRAKGEQSWTPFARLLAVLGGLAALAAVIGLYLALVHK
jgi:hypothetical protein